jgi:hypothetical protein
MPQTYIPFEGDISGYGYGPEHEFFLWDVAADSLNDAGGGISGAVPTPRPRPAGIQGWRNPNDESGGGSPYGGSATVEQSGRMNNPAQTERAIDVHRRGTADLTAENLAKAAAFGLGIASGTGPIKLGAQLAAGEIMGRPGFGVPDFSGSVPATQWGRDLVKRGVPVRDVQRMERERAAIADRVARGDSFLGKGYGGPPDRAHHGGVGGGGGGNYASGDRAATEAHDRSMEGRGYADGGIAGWWRPPETAPMPARFMDRIAMYQRPALPRRGIGPMDEPPIKTPSIKRPIDPTIIHRQPPGYADGGIVGAVRSSSPGRSDAVDAKAEAGTYVIPADVVSALGQGNTAAGVKWLDRAVEKLMQGDTGAFGFKRGGRVPIRVSGGEYAVPPAAVSALGRGSYENGARKLEALIAHIRQQAGRGMPAPRR